MLELQNALETMPGKVNVSGFSYILHKAEKPQGILSDINFGEILVFWEILQMIVKFPQCRVFGHHKEVRSNLQISFFFLLFYFDIFIVL